MSLLTDLRALPPAARRMLALSMVNNLGTGLILPFLVVYIHQVHGLPLQAATTAIALVSAAVMVGAPLAGWLADRLGAAFAAGAHALVQGLGIVGYAVSSETWHFMVAAVVVGIGAGGSSAWNALFAETVPARQHPVVFSLNFTCANASVGIGGLIGAAVAAVDNLWSFRLLYLADAATSLLVGGFFLLMWRRARAPRRAAGERQEAPPASVSYLVVLRQPAFAMLLLFGGLLFCATYVQLESGLPAYLTTETGVSASSLALLFAANTACILASQVLLHNKLTTLRHVRSLSIAAALWTVSWLLVLGTSWLTGVGRQFAVLVLAIGIFAVAETFHAAGMPTLVNELALPQARGKFNAAYGTSTSFGFIVGPLAAGALIVGGAGRWFIGGLAVLCALLALAFAGARLWLGHSSSPAAEPMATEPVGTSVP